MKSPRLATPVSIVLSLLTTQLMPAEEVTVRTEQELKTALTAIKPGTTLKIGPGDYAGGKSVQGISQLTIEALDPKNPPHFKGGSCAWQFSRCDQLTLRHLRLSGQSDNGINLDDGGKLDSPVSGITVERLDISDIGPKGNHDGIKCSGLAGLTIRGCTITGWGGQGIDFVGCHKSLITGCKLTGKEGFSGSAGIQLKGGSSEIVVEKCEFTNAGERPLNIGGSTGAAYFRPHGAKHEASKITARHNTIQGGICAAAFVGVDGAEFSNNTILFPDKWIFRILQETTEPGFAPCRNVVVRENHVIFNRSNVRTDINIGPGTKPETFQFEKNQWFAEDDPSASKPQLPSPEKNGTHGTDPRQ